MGDCGGINGSIDGDLNYGNGGCSKVALAVVIMMMVVGIGAIAAPMLTTMFTEVFVPVFSKITCFWIRLFFLFFGMEKKGSMLVSSSIQSIFSL